jgi:hypothetical protein
MRFIVILAACTTLLSLPAGAQDDAAAELAKKLANPVAALISVPLQYNYDENYGPDDEGSVHRLNIQPVIPMSLNEKWNLIGRVILPLVDLRLGGRGVVGAGQRNGLTVAQDRPADDPGRRRGAVLGRLVHKRGGRLGRAGHADAPVPEVKRRGKGIENSVPERCFRGGPGIEPKSRLVVVAVAGAEPAGPQFAGQSGPRLGVAFSF